MVKSSDFALTSCQATLFTPDEEISASKLMSGLLPRWLGRFDGDPTMLPVPAGVPVPRDMPRVILQAASGAWRCEIASARINLSWRKTKRETQILPVAEFFKDATKLLNEYRDFLECRVGRLAAVLNRYVIQPSPGRFLAEHFCQDRWLRAPLNRPEGFELHAHKSFKLGGRFQVNSWVRNKTGKLTEDDERRPIILVEQDINTLVEEVSTSAFSTDEMAAFFAAVTVEFDHILNLYYPTEGRE